MAYTKIFTINCHGVVASLVRNSTTITTISGTENAAISGNNLNMSNYITATACTPAYSASGLPTGLTINSSTGVISGTPTSSATGNITITVSATGLQSVTFTVPYNIEAAGSSGSSSGGGSGYIVSGTGWPAYDGTYVDSGTTNNGQPVYIYGNYALWMYHFYYVMVGVEVDAWVISTADKVTSSDVGNPIDYGCKFYGEVSSSTVTPDNVSYWNDGSNIVNISVTPTGGGGSSGSSSSGGSSFIWGTTNPITVSGANDRYNGAYTWDGSKYVKDGNLDIWIRNPDSSTYQIFDDDYGSVIYQYSGSNIGGTNSWSSSYYGANAQITISDSSGGESSGGSSGSSGGSFVWGVTTTINIDGYHIDAVNGDYNYSSGLDRYISINRPSSDSYEAYTIRQITAGSQYGLNMASFMYGGTAIGSESSDIFTLNAPLIGTQEVEPFINVTVSVVGEGSSSGGDSSSGSSSGGLPTEPIGTEKLVISGGGGMVWSTYNGDYVIVAGTSSSTDSIWYNSSNGYYILYVDGYWRVDSDGVAPFDASIDTRLSPSDWDGVSDTSYNLTFTYSSGGSSGGGSFVWETTQSFTISGSGSSAINTTYTWNAQSYAYKANDSDYWVTYMAGPDQASITYNQSMTEYYIDGTGGNIGGTKTWTNLMSGGSETLTVTVIS